MEWGFCYNCGKKLERAIKIEVPCPACAVMFTVRLCPECAAKLKESIERQLAKSK